MTASARGQQVHEQVHLEVLRGGALLAPPYARQRALQQRDDRRHVAGARFHRHGLAVEQLSRAAIVARALVVVRQLRVGHHALEHLRAHTVQPPALRARHRLVCAVLDLEVPEDGSAC